MTYYLLPSSLNNRLHESLGVKFGPEHPPCSINNSLHAYLSDIKLKINELEAWDVTKKYTNPYEYIHTTVPGFRTSVCKYKPLSRSYFKMIEMMRSLYLLDSFSDIPVKTFHLAEGPGGFIEAVTHVRAGDTHLHTHDEYYGMTLVDDAEYVPGWKKSREFLEQNPRVKIVTGEDGTGNILTPENLAFCYEHHKNSVHFLTGDGGFDFSADFLNQESSAAVLVFAQIMYAVLMQKKGGHFVIKLFDVFTRPTQELIYFLTGLYSKVYLIKPNTSRYANSERYLVCKHFLVEDSSPFYPKFLEALSRLAGIADQKLISIFDIELPHYFLTRLEEYNAILGQQQIETINATLQLGSNPYSHRADRLETLKRNNILRCIQWCTRNRQGYYKTMNALNIFLPRAQNTLLN